MIYHADMRQPDDQQQPSNNAERVSSAFGQALREARARTYLSQEELAFRSGIHRTQISQLELGRRLPRLDTVIKLAGALGVDPRTLVTEVRWVPPSDGPRQGRFS